MLINMIFLLYRRMVALFTDKNSIYREILDNCFGNIFVTDGKGEIIYLNENAVVSLGYPKEKLLGMTMQQVYLSSEN